ncbi:MAG TPA: hypothetical protein P5531_10345 [Bacteroidales bacterium]|nr:hypothetical protein [Bacteroidales bacterium]HSA44038.1 hypothetical protein [Bacteroidales bacterium]
MDGWAPLGPQASYLVKDIRCGQCRSRGGSCRCMTEIRAGEVAEMLEKRRAESGILGNSNCNPVFLLFSLNC